MSSRPRPVPTDPSPAPRRAAGPQGTDQVSRRRLRTRGRLIDAARVVVTAKGIQGASVEEICEEAGFTRGAFYSNYGDKDDLLLALVERERQRFFDSLDLDVASLGLEATIEQILAAHTPKADSFILQVELILHAMRSPDFAPRAVEADRAFVGRIVEALRVGLEQLGLEPVTSLGVLAEVLVGVSDRSFRTALLEGSDDPLRLARQTLPHILRTFTRPVDAGGEAQEARMPRAAEDGTGPDA